MCVYCTLARGVPTSIIVHSWWCLQAKTTMRNTPQAHNLSCQRAARQWLLFLQNKGPGSVLAHLSCRLPKATTQPISYPNRAQPNEANLWYSSVTLPTNKNPDSPQNCTHLAHSANSHLRNLACKYSKKVQQATSTSPAHNIAS
jgi:hypothetical protein